MPTIWRTAVGLMLMAFPPVGAGALPARLQLRLFAGKPAIGKSSVPDGVHSTISGRHAPILLENAAVQNRTNSEISSSPGEPRNRRQPDIVALRQLLERRTFGAAAADLGLLRVGEFGGAAHVLPTRLRPAPAFCRAGADQVALYVGQ